MKALSVVLILFTSLCMISCDKTNKQDTKTKNPDTMVMKKDTAIKRIDTAGYNK